MKAYAGAPAHISAFFSPRIQEDVDSTGSIGAGICLKRGAVAEIDIESGEGRKVFRLNGVERELAVTAMAVSILEERAKKSVHGSFNIKTDFPDSQGFGISAAGTLAVSLALSHLLSLSKRDALVAAHRAEVMNRTGLGDVIAEFEGGAVLRERGGLPPAGETARFRIVSNDEEAGLIVALIGEKIETRSVLNNSAAIERIKVAGEKAVEEFHTRIHREKKEYYISASEFLRISRRFASEAAVITPELSRAIEAIESIGLGKRYPSSMVMLGNALFFLPPSSHMEEALLEIKKALSPVYPSAHYYVDEISKQGAYLID